MGTDLDALQAIEHTGAPVWDGQALRLTRRGMRQSDEGAIVVAWALRNADGTNRWLRWQSPRCTRAEWSEAWARAAQWRARPAAPSARRALMPPAGWQLYYRGGAWANARSATLAPALPQAPAG